MITEVKSELIQKLSSDLKMKLISIAQPHRLEAEISQ